MHQPSRWPPAIGALAVMAIVFGIVYSSVHSARQNDALVEYVRADKVADDAERREASAERRALFAAIDRLEAQRKADNANREALLAWLRTQGIGVPEYILRGDDSDDSDSDDDGDSDSSSEQEGSGKQSPPKSVPPKPDADDKPDDRRPDRGDDGSDRGSDRGRGSEHSDGRSDAKGGNADKSKRDK